MSHVVQRLQPFGETIFATMTARADQFDAINLGQGFPDSDGPFEMLEIAQREIASGNNQYGPAVAWVSCLRRSPGNARPAGRRTGRWH